MRKIVKFVWCIFVFFLPTQAFSAQNVPILIYHSIDEYTGHGMKELYVTPENFEKQMIYLRDHGFTLLTFDRWDEMDKVNKPIFITLDDGYKNNLRAFTILQKLESKQFKPAATFFIISDFIDNDKRLSQSDLKKMANSKLASIQSHTATHPNLTKITDFDYELKSSKEKIEKITGKPVIALAYPYGSFNSIVVEETKKYYSFGLTTTPELYSEGTSKDEKYQLPRIYVKYTTTLLEFAKMVDAK